MPKECDGVVIETVPVKKYRRSYQESPVQAPLDFYKMQRNNDLHDIEIPKLLLVTYSEQRFAIQPS